MEPPTVREVIRRLEREGWVFQGMRGDHRKYCKDGIHVTIPGNKGEHLKVGTYASIRSIVGW